MSKFNHAITIERVVNGRKEEKVLQLNGKEYILYKKLLENLGNIVQVTSLMTELEMNLSHLRVTKRNLSRLLEGWAIIDSKYGNGYKLTMTLNT